MTADRLYTRMEENLFACFSSYARGAQDASVQRLAGVGVAVFPQPPESIVYNNAVLARGLGRQDAAAAIARTEDSYASAGVVRYAIWIHDAEAPSIEAVEAAGLEVDMTTRAMAMSLDALPPGRPGFDARSVDWSEYLEMFERLELPPGLLAGVDPAGFHVLVAPADGDAVAASLAFDHNGDTGIYNVGTMPAARRRGIASGLTALQLQAARERGSTTASLQATEAAERIYARAGFRDLGRFIEYVRPS